MKTSLNRAFGVILLAVGLTGLVGCTTRLGDFTVLSTKNVDVSGVKQGERVSGEDCKWIVFVPLGTVDWKNAMDQALQKGKGDVMVDVVMTAKLYGLSILGQQCIEMEGTVSQTASYSR